jgi:hypothetical protein
MTTTRSQPAVTLALGALVIAFAIAFGLGKLTTKSTAPPTPAKTQIISLTSHKPTVPHLEGGGTIPALKAVPKQNATKPANPGSGTNSNSGSSGSQSGKSKRRQKETPDVHVGP